MKSDQEIQEMFNSLLEFKNEDEQVEHDAFMIMAGFLSEIERVQKQKNVNRKKLAELIKTSGSYLTQVFRGDKPLNFITIAKIQKVLDIKFDISAQYNSVIKDSLDGKDAANYYKSSKFKPNNLYLEIISKIDDNVKSTTIVSSND